MGTERLICLGTGSMMLSGGRGTASYLLESEHGRTLLDAGPGCLSRLASLGIPATSIRRILISHLHPDHHADLLGLLFQRRNPALREELQPLSILGPKGKLREVYAAWCGVYGSWIQDESVEVLGLGLGSQDHEGFCFDAYPVRHSAPALCFRVHLSEGRILAYSGDSESCEGLSEACREADFALVECSHPDEDACAGHMSPSAIRNLSREVEPKRIGLTHFYPAMEAKLAEPGFLEREFGDLPSEVLILEDLMEIRP
jgi:ribonuclease BN (tRNA processing enzyme)